MSLRSSLHSEKHSILKECPWKVSSWNRKPSSGTFPSPVIDERAREKRIFLKKPLRCWWDGKSVDDEERKSQHTKNIRKILFTFFPSIFHPLTQRLRQTPWNWKRKKSQHWKFTISPSFSMLNFHFHTTTRTPPRAEAGELTQAKRCDAHATHETTRENRKENCNTD